MGRLQWISNVPRAPHIATASAAKAYLEYLPVQYISAMPALRCLSPYLRAGISVTLAPSAPELNRPLQKF
eukprot:765826-Hanusia_phi.AAC.8